MSGSACASASSGSGREGRCASRDARRPGRVCPAGCPSGGGTVFLARPVGQTSRCSRGPRQVRVLPRSAPAQLAPALPLVPQRAGAADPAADRLSRPDVGRGPQQLHRLPRRSPRAGFRDGRLGAGRAAWFRPSQRRLAAGRQTFGRPLRELPRQPPPDRTGHRPCGRRQSQTHDLPGAGVPLRQLSLRRTPRPARARLPALPQRRRLDFHVRPFLRSRQQQLSPARKTQAGGLCQLPPGGRRRGHSAGGVCQTTRGHVRTVQTGRARQLRELPPRSSPGGLRRQLRGLPQRERLGRRQSVAASRRQLPRCHPVSAAGPPPRCRVQELPRSVRSTPRRRTCAGAPGFATGAIQRALVPQVWRLPPGRPPGATGRSVRRRPTRLRGVPYGHRVFTRALRARGSQQDPVSAGRLAPRGGVPELPSRRRSARQAR